MTPIRSCLPLGLWLWAAVAFHVACVALSLFNEFVQSNRSHQFLRNTSLQARPADVPHLPDASRVDKQTWIQQQQKRQDRQGSALPSLPIWAPNAGPTSAPGGPDPSIANADDQPTLGPGLESLPPAPALQPSPAPPFASLLAPTIAAPTSAPLPTPEPTPAPTPAPAPAPAPRTPTTPTTPSTSSPGPPPKYRHYNFNGYLAPPDPVCRNAKFRPEIEAAAAAVRDLRHSTESRCPDWKKWAREWVEKQFEPWKDGITMAMHRKTRRYGHRAFHPTLIRLESKDESGKLNLTAKDHRGRVAWAAYMKRAIKNWPFNASELKPFFVWAEHGDWPAIAKEDPQAVGTAPALANSLNDNFVGVMMPTGNRAQYLDKEIDNRRQVPKHPGMRKRAFELADKVPWKDRADVAVWRGTIGCTFGAGKRGKNYYPNVYLENHSQLVRSTGTFNPWPVGTGYGCMETDGERSNLWMRHPRFLASLYTISCGKECGLDAKSFGGEDAAWVNDEIEASGEPNLTWAGDYMSDEQTAAARYVFNIGNHAGYADRWWRMLALGSVVLNVEMGWKEWFSPLMIPYVNYVPVREDLADVCEQLAWLRENPEEAELIAKRGREVVEQCIHIPMVDIYTAEVMRQLGALWEKGRLQDEADKLERQQRRKERKEQKEQKEQLEQNKQFEQKMQEQPQEAAPP